MTKTREPRTKKQTLRLTESEYAKIKEAAARYSMSISEFCRSKSLDTRERKNYERRNMNTKIVRITKSVNDIYDHIARTDSEYISTTELLPLLDHVKKGCDAVWNR